MSAAQAATAGRSVVSRLLLGNALRDLREGHGLTRLAVSEAVSLSPATISGVELGRIPALLRDLNRLCDLYRVDDLRERTRLIGLARAASAPNWWAGFEEVIPRWFEPFLGLEDAAERIRSYDMQFVPGILQHPDYARAVINLDAGAYPAHELDHRLALRMLRQRRLSGEHSPKIWAVIDEAALRRIIGSRQIMFRQLQHLAELSSRPNIAIQILPFNAGGFATGSGPVILLSLPDLPDVVYLEQLTTALYLDAPDEADRYRKVLDHLALQAAAPDRTPEILQAMMRDL